jgi:hypothetical protein
MDGYVAGRCPTECWMLVEIFRNTRDCHHFSTVSVDNSVCKLFSQAQKALVSAIVTDWLKSKQ